MRRAFLLTPFALALLAGCSLVGSDGAPETVTGRWVGSVTTPIDTTYRPADATSSRHFVGSIQHRFTLTLADDSGTLTGNFALRRRGEVAMQALDGTVLDETEVDEAYESDLTGVYATPFMDIEVEGGTYRDIDLEVRGTRATGAFRLVGFDGARHVREVTLERQR